MQFYFECVLFIFTYEYMQYMYIIVFLNMYPELNKNVYVYTYIYVYIYIYMYLSGSHFRTLKGRDFKTSQFIIGHWILMKLSTVFFGVGPASFSRS